MGHMLPSAHRHAFSEAFRRFGVVGIFGLCGARKRGEETEYVPLVYIAKADDTTEAREIHRATWSQGIVPFLIVSTSDKVWSCNGLTYAPRNWERLTAHIPAGALEGVAILPAAIAHLAARSLRTSVVWTDREMGFEDRVDMHLLKNLTKLEMTMRRRRSGIEALPLEAANAYHDA